MSPLQHGGSGDYADPCLLKGSNRWQHANRNSPHGGLFHSLQTEGGYALPRWAVTGLFYSQLNGINLGVPWGLKQSCYICQASPNE